MVFACRLGANDHVRDMSPPPTRCTMRPHSIGVANALRKTEPAWWRHCSIVICSIMAYNLVVVVQQYADTPVRPPALSTTSSCFAACARAAWSKQQTTTAR